MKGRGGRGYPVWLILGKVLRWIFRKYFDPERYLENIE
jgi:hypothetical protein